jgi:glycosyltransferase involved in cell wall biosynthesis
VKSVAGLVDVLIPTFEHEEFIDECINSVFGQDYGNLLVHVFDDCSTDKTFEKLTKLQEKWGTRMRVYRNAQRLGNGDDSILHQAPNLRGEFWAILEGDDFWLTRDKLTQQVSILMSNPGAIAVASKTEIRSPNLGEVRIIEPDVISWNYLDLILNSNRLRHYVHVSSILWRNSYPERNIPWPDYYCRSESLKGEVMLMHEILKDTGGSVVLYDKITSVYRLTGRGIWSSLTENQQRTANEFLMETIRKRRPPLLKLAQALGLSKFFHSKTLN